MQIGDWGRHGTLNQTEVATLMGELAFERAPEFVISTGDNFYLRACVRFQGVICGKWRALSHIDVHAYIWESCHCKGMSSYCSRASERLQMLT